ncbi:hypothetical protein [Pseudokineococcus sp. 1T1Z-3]|uniref:hypothetical protein n=1 Tax=Pseudokineococcus sp. 1T1Z-3 TaxID=3132745 RepID=UPI00309A83CD
MQQVVRYERERAALANDKQNNRLRLIITIWAISASSTMLVLSTAAFGVYVGSQWGQVPAWAIGAYLASTVTEVLGILYVVANYLFPKRVHAASTNE